MMTAIVCVLGFHWETAILAVGHWSFPFGKIVTYQTRLPSMMRHSPFVFATIVSFRSEVATDDSDNATESGLDERHNIG